MHRLLAAIGHTLAGIVRDIARGMRAHYYLRTHRATGCTAFMTGVVTQRNREREGPEVR